MASLTPAPTPAAATPETSSADLRYPIGRLSKPTTLTAEDRRQWIETLRELPKNLRDAVDGLTASQLDTPYREGGWTVRQLVHHIADSHMNMHCRARKALTEEWPPVTDYDEKRWAELADTKTLPIAASLDILSGIHQRMVALFEALGEDEWSRGYVHPVRGRSRVDETLALYSWHSRHHTAHITALRTRMGW